MQRRQSEHSKLWPEQSGDGGSASNAGQDLCRNRGAGVATVIVSQERRWIGVAPQDSHSCSDLTEKGQPAIHDYRPLRRRIISCSRKSIAECVTESERRKALRTPTKSGPQQDPDHEPDCFLTVPGSASSRGSRPSPGGGAGRAADRAPRYADAVALQRRVGSREVASTPGTSAHFSSWNLLGHRPSARSRCPSPRACRG